MKQGHTLLCAAKLHENQLERHLELFEYLPEVERVIVVRRGPLSNRLGKLDQRIFRQGSRVGEAVRMAQTIGDILKREHVDWVLGFNPVPWGSVALGVAKCHRVRCCLSLIGMDFLQLKQAWGGPFLAATRQADAVTVTGITMLEQLVQKGVDRAKIRILPHSVDPKRFTAAPMDEAFKFDVISVGQLIERKRMDVLVDAVALLKQRRVRVRVAILGKGPLEAQLKERVARLELGDQITFMSYRDDVEVALRSAKIFCLASEWEGVPFALMEAMSCAIVPVVTDVGTIVDWVKDGHNGRVVPPGEVAALAQALESLVCNPELFHQMRARLLSERASLGFEKGAAVWRDILSGESLL